MNIHKQGAKMSNESKKLNLETFPVLLALELDDNQYSGIVDF